MNDRIILVNEHDLEIGLMPKLEVHQKGILHRAFSVFIFNTKGELLIQKRAINKYHSGGLWSNTCCSHPHSGEEIKKSAVKRLKEEMGITCELQFVFSFIYKANFDNGLIEHEFDHVFLGISDQLPSINKSEVDEWKYQNMKFLYDDINVSPDKYTQWLINCFDKVSIHFEKMKANLS